ncbi:hypothetical protein [Halomonas sp. BM-2019]|uniref:hypothetical protein n=1 Tax=Halomonas sp. BM-2019 TaxID=2811227 RepID=UPI001B3C355B|nr:MAG: hypothetical protein J5F18_16045 [Halomonas sp. BM-2019]
MERKPTTEEEYTLLLQIEQIEQIEQIVHLRPETEPCYEPGAVVTLTNGEELILKTPFKELVRELEEVKMILRP